MNHFAAKILDYMFNKIVLILLKKPKTNFTMRLHILASIRGGGGQDYEQFKITMLVLFIPKLAIYRRR